MAKAVKLVMLKLNLQKQI